MVTSNRSRPALLRRIPYQVIVLALGGGTMLAASLLPWLADPLGGSYSAWQLPVDIGWQLHASIFNYGLLCLCCALYAFVVAAQAWGTLNKHQPAATHENSQSITTFVAGNAEDRNTSQTLFRTIRQRLLTVFITTPVTTQPCIIAGLLCLIPPVVFVMQYLYIDMGSVAQLARNEMQYMLVKAHFDYGTAAQFAPIQIMQFDPLTIHSRVALLLDQVGGGFFLPLAGAFLPLAARKFFPRTMRIVPLQKRRLALVIVSGIALLAMVILGRGPVALAANYQAEHLLSIGDYAGALTWLDRAYTLNPALDQLSSYHLERGQAWYYLHPQQTTAESQAYLASFYRQQNDYLSSYEELLSARQKVPQSRWLVDELSNTLERLAEMPHPLNGAPTLRTTIEEPSITWLQEITQVDATNVYGHYMIGRLKYDLHDYAGSEAQMNQVLNLSQETEIQSSAFTYLALSNAGEGDYVTARHYLFRAQDADPAFRNNIAREEISGLR